MKKHPSTATPVRRSYSRVLAMGAVMSVVGLAGVGLVTNSEAATSTSANTEAKLVKSIENVRGAAVYQYGAKDSQNESMDTAKVIANPSPKGGYIAVYHFGANIKVATSKDLKKWKFHKDIHHPATQPTIKALSNGGFLVADENEASDRKVHFMYYPNLTALLAGKASKSFTAPLKLSKCNEGTPDIISADLKPDINRSVIKVGFHFAPACGGSVIDREATGTLTNFSQWQASANKEIDNALVASAKQAGKAVNGNIGDRDHMKYGKTLYGLYEVQYKRGDFGTWQLHLYNTSTRKARELKMKTHKGSTAFANPTFTAAKGPDGRKGIIVGAFIHKGGAAPGEGGQLIYFVPDSAKAKPKQSAFQSIFHL